MMKSLHLHKHLKGPSSVGHIILKLSADGAFPADIVVQDDCRNETKQVVNNNQKKQLQEDELRLIDFSVYSLTK